MATPEKYSHINFKPPAGVRKEAAKGLAWRREHGRGGTSVGIARARDLSNGTTLSPSTVRRIKAYFDRHESDKSGTGWSPKDDGFPSNGRIAWALWGSDAGRAFANKVVAQMNAADEKEGRALRPFGSTHGMKPKVTVVHGPPASGKTTYVMQHKGENDVLFDFDRVMSAISGLPTHQPSKPLISYCTEIRDLIINKALRSQSVGRTWIITTNVSDDMKGQLSDIPVEYIHIDTPKDECLKRITEDPERQAVAEELRQVVEEYFATNTGEQRSAQVSAAPNVERRFVGNFSTSERTDPELLRVERRADPVTGVQQTYCVGYAARFHKNSLLLGDFIERIDPSAFSIVEAREDSEGRPLETRCLFNHDPNHLLGRFPTTMKMFVDDKGLRYECLLPESRKDIAESIARGDLKGSSFSFVVAEGGERWSTENGRSIRLVTKIKSLLDCGPVTYPAYGDATVAVVKRSYEAFVAGKKGDAERRLVARSRMQETRSRAASVMAAASEFVSERRGFCPTGDGGGIDNSCGKDGDQPSGGDAPSSPSSGGKADSPKGSSPAEAKADIEKLVSGKKVEMDSVSDVNMMLEQFAEMANNPANFGGKPPVYDLCKVSVPGTNLFCGDSLGIDRAEMPQAKGQPVPGSPADKLPRGKGGEVDGTDAFISHMKKAGFSVGSPTSVPAASLKATQANMQGEKVAGMVVAKDFDPGKEAIFVSKDGYVVDGHHRWAAVVGRDAKDGKLGDSKMNVVVIDAPIKTIIDEANKFTSEFGIARKKVAASESKRYLELVEFFAERRASGDCGRESGGKFGSGNKCAAGESMELSGDDHRSPEKMKQAQEFIDRAREGQLARGGKSEGKSDDGGGVQTWSKGEHFPWTVKQVGTDSGYVQGLHPDGSKTAKYEFADGDTKAAVGKLKDELKQQKRSHDPRQTARDMIAFLKGRRG